MRDRQPDQIPDFARTLEKALAWKTQLPDCPFLFFTRSFLFAVVYAGHRIATGRGKNVTIVCIKPSTATTEAGTPAQFHAASALIKKFDVSLRPCRDGSAREYAHEMAATTSVVPGEGSFHVSYSTLVASGLYEFYPALGEVSERDGPRLNLAVEDLRKYGFDREWPLTRDKMRIAHRLAGCFIDCVKMESSPVSVEAMNPILAAILALQKRPVGDLALGDVISDNNGPSTSTAPTALAKPQPAALPEVQQHVQLQKQLHGVAFSQGHLHAHSAVNNISTREEIANWHSWWRQNRHAYRISHPKSDLAPEDRARRSQHGQGSFPRRDRERRYRPDYRRTRLDRTQDGRTGRRRSGYFDRNDDARRSSMWHRD